MLLVLLEQVNRAVSKYVFDVWIGNQIRKYMRKHRRLRTYVKDVSSSIKWFENGQFFEYFNVIGTVRTRKSCRFQICMHRLDRKPNTRYISPTQLRFPRLWILLT